MITDVNGNPVPDGGALPWNDPNKDVRTIEIDPQSGRRYVAVNGVFSSWMDPVPSSGGTSVSVYNPASVGANRYVTLTVPPGGDESGLPVGTVYQKDLGDNSIQVVQRPSANVNPADKNNDGLDDTTNMALGVYKDSNSPTGFSYGMGQPVYPNGAPYTGSGGGNIAEPNLKTINGRAVIWDPQKGMYVDAPGITQSTGPGSMSSGGGSYTVSGPRASSVGSSASSGGTARDYAAEQAAQNAAQAQMQKDSQAFTASQNALDRAQKDAQFQANYGLSVQQFQAQQAKDAADARLGLIDRYGAAVSDTDQAKLQSLRMALGNGTGDVSLVDLLRNAGPGAFQANEAAAALLGEIRGQPASPTGTGMAPVTTPTGTGGATGTTPTTGTGMTPVTTPTGTTPATPTGTTLPGQGAASNEVRAPLRSIWGGDQTSRDNNTAISAWYDPANWTNVGNPNPTGGGVDYYQSTITGEKVPATIWSQMLQANQGAAQQETQQQNFWAGASITPDQAVSNSRYGYTPQAVDSLGQHTGVSSQTFNPYAPNYTGPGAMNLGGDNIARPMPEGTVQPRATTTVAADTNPTQPSGFSPGQAVPTGGLQSGYTYDPSTNTYIPHAAHGTERPMMGPIVTGDPQVPGQPNPELTVWTPQGNIVRPLNTMHPMMRPVMDGLPHAGFGTFSALSSNPVYNFFNRQPSPTTTAPQPTAPTPVATTPTQPAPAPQQQPITQQPQPVTNTQPAMQPVTQPQPTTVGGTTVSTTPTPNPADPLALTPQSTQYINDVANFRTNLQYPHLNQLDVSWGRLAPSLQQTNYQGFQTETGIPIGDQQQRQQRYAFAGRPTMSSVAGY